MVSYEALLNALTILLLTIDPIGTAPMFLVLTRGMSRKERLSAALRATSTAAAVLLLFSVGGIAILARLGITIHAFRVAGGLLLLWMAFEMIYERSKEEYEKTTEEVVKKKSLQDVALFPLAIPLIAGPGTISATVLLSHDFGGFTLHMVLIAIIIACTTLTYITYVLAEGVNRFITQNGLNVLTRLLGILLGALSVQYIWDGIHGLNTGLP